MSKSPPASAADTHSGVPTYERVVIGPGAVLKRLLALGGVVVGLILPAALLLFDPYGYDITCTRAEQRCVILEHHAFETLRSEVTFEDLKVVQAHIEWSGGGSGNGRRQQTGRVMITFETHAGRSIDASLNATPEELRLPELEAYLRSPDAPQFKTGSRLSASDRALMVVVFLIGLLMLAGTRWRTEVTRDTATSTIVVTRHLWPLLKRTTLRVNAADIDEVRLKRGELGTVVSVRMMDGNETRVARTATGGAADIAAVLRRMHRRPASGRGKLPT